MQLAKKNPTEPLRLCVYCGARSGRNLAYTQEAYGLGQALAKASIELVYGGGGQGMMGAVSQGVLDGGGQVIGVIPEALMAREFGRRDIARMEVVRDMHTRKQLMAELSDAIVALPGGLGTMDELFEIMTWAQLGFHQKPIALLNTAGYFDDWLKWLGIMEREGFFDAKEKGLPQVVSTPAQIIGILR